MKVERAEDSEETLTSQSQKSLSLRYQSGGGRLKGGPGGAVDLL